MSAAPHSTAPLVKIAVLPPPIPAPCGGKVTSFWYDFPENNSSSVSWISSDPQIPPPALQGFLPWLSPVAFSRGLLDTARDSVLNRCPQPILPRVPT